MGFGCTRDGVMSCGGDGQRGWGELKIGLNWVRSCVGGLELGVGRVTCQFFHDFQSRILWPATPLVFSLECSSSSQLKFLGEKFEGLKRE
jgi:hypothetical protein